eukprot:87997_1
MADLYNEQINLIFTEFDQFLEEELQSDDDVKSSYPGNDNHDLKPFTSTKTRLIGSSSKGIQTKSTTSPTKHQDQSADKITNTANTIIKNLSKRVEALDSKIANTKNVIQTMGSISSLYVISEQAIITVQNQIAQYEDPRDVNSFYMDTVTAQQNILQYNQSIQSDLDQNIKIHSSQLQTVQQNLNECEQQIKALQEKQVRLYNARKTIGESIKKFKWEKDQKKVAMNASISTVSQKKTEVHKAYSVFLNKLEQFENSKTLQESIYDRVKHFEASYNEWTVNDLTAWIRFINNRYFDCYKYESFLNRIAEMNVNGSQIREMHSKLFLKMAGLDAESQCILLKNVARITKLSNRNICGFCATNNINTVMIPCGHQYFCHECLMKQDNISNHCPICRKKVSKSIKTFMSGFD